MDDGNQVGEALIKKHGPYNHQQSAAENLLLIIKSTPRKAAMTDSKSSTHQLCRPSSRRVKARLMPIKLSMTTIRPRMTERMSRMELGENSAKMPIAAVMTPMTSSK